MSRSASHYKEEARWSRAPWLPSSDLSAFSFPGTRKAYRGRLCQRIIGHHLERRRFGREAHLNETVELLGWAARLLQ